MAREPKDACSSVVTNIEICPISIALIWRRKLTRGSAWLDLAPIGELAHGCPAAVRQLVWNYFSSELLHFSNLRNSRSTDSISHLSCFESKRKGNLCRSVLNFETSSPKIRQNIVRNIFFTITTTTSIFNTALLLISYVLSSPSTHGSLFQAEETDCDVTQRPVSVKSCHLDPCPRGEPPLGNWQTGEWSKCSLSCGGRTNRTSFNHSILDALGTL